MRILRYLVLILLAGLASAQTVVQSKQCQDWNVTAFTDYPCAFNVPTTAGNSIIVMSLNGDNFAMTVSDNAGHTYLTDLNFSFGGGGQRVILASASGVSSAQTIHVTSANSFKHQVILMEVLGTATKDISATNDNGFNGSGNGGPYPFTSGNVITTQANDLLVGWSEQLFSTAPDFTFTDTPSWTLVQQEPIGGSRVASRNVTATGTYAYTGTFSGPPADAYETFAGIVAYKVLAPAVPTAKLYFSDLTWGPKTGWDNGSTKGAAVTIWGQDLGTSGAVNACGQALSSSNAAQVAEWNATTNPTVPRGMGRITFWLNPAMSAACAEGISVTSNGYTTSTLPFTIAAGTIYYVSTTGNDANAGTTLAAPFRHVYKFNPANGLGDTQYIMYVRGGTYNTVDPFNGNAAALVELYGPWGSSVHQKALIAYPGELATMSLAACDHGFVYQNSDPGGTGGGLPDDYFTWSKLFFDGTGITREQDVIDMYGKFNRIVGIQIQNFRPSTQLQSGFTFVGASQNGSIYGNYYFNNGFDSFAHQIYIKTQTGYPVSNTLLQTHDIDVGWNEISTPFSNDNHGGAIFLSRESLVAAGFFTFNIFIHHNYFHDGTQGDFIYVADGSEVNQVYIYSNIFSKGSSTAGFTGVPFFQTGSFNIFVYNNTIYQVTQGATSNSCMYSSSPNASEHIVTENNICFGNSGYTQYIFESGGGSWASTNDFFFNPGGSATWSGSVTRTSPTVNVNPLFTTNGSDFHLQTSSPARSAGANLTSAMAGLPSSTIDYEGKLLPSAGAWDVGAYQFGVTAAVTPDFSLSASPTNQAVARGTSGSAITITVTGSGGFNSAVALTATGLPAGVTAVFAPTSCTPPIASPFTCTSALTLTASGTATLGAATVTVNGNAGVHTASIALSVTGPAPVPSCTPSGGIFKSGRLISCTNAVPLATTCWRVGTPPTTNGNGTCTAGTTYIAPFMVSATGTLFVTGTQSGNTDSSTSYSFTINPTWTTGWIMNSPATGTSTFGSTLRTYAGLTSLAIATIPTPPNVGGIAGAGTIFTDPVYGTKGVRLTDACFDPSMAKVSATCPNSNGIIDNGNNSYSGSQDGSADDLEFNTGDFLTIVANQGGAHYLVGFNPNTLALSRPYASATSGCPIANCSSRGGWATFDGVDLSLANPCIIWDTKDTALTSYTFGSDVVPWSNPCSPAIVGPPAAVTVVDLVEDSPAACVGTACNGLPSDFGTATWTASGGESLGDAIMVRAFSSANYYRHPVWKATNAYSLNSQIKPLTNNPNNYTFQVTVAGTSGSTEPNWNLTCPALNNTCTDGTVTWKNQNVFANQGTGIYVVIWSPTKGAMSYNTATGAIQGDPGWAGGAGLTCDANGCSGTSTANAGAQFTIHNLRMNKSGNAIAISPTYNLSGTGACSWQWIWVPGTTTVYCSQTTKASGHWVLGSKGQINDPGGPLYQFYYRLEPAAGPSGTPIAINNIPTSPACTVNSDQHSSWQSADANDTWPFLSGRSNATIANSGLMPFDPPVCPWVNELVMVDMNGSGLSHRVAFTFNTGFSIFFNSQWGIPEMSPSGRFASAGSDWLNNLRNAAGTAVCNGIASPTATCIPNGPAWKTAKVYALNYIINPTTTNAGNFSYRATVAGTSGASQPLWSTNCVTVGSTCSDNGITWTNVGSPAGVNAPGTDAFLWDLLSAH